MRPGRLCPGCMFVCPFVRWSITSFNEAGALVPRMRLEEARLVEVICACFNEAGALVPRMR